MITYTMTKDELYRELASDAEWLIGLSGGIAIKYKKKLTLKTAPEGFHCLGISRYTTPKNNKVFCSWLSVRANNVITVEQLCLFEYVTKSGVVQYVAPCFPHMSNRPNNVIIYTAHAIERLRDRAGLSFEDMLRYSAEFPSHHRDYYEYKGEKKEMFDFGDKGMFICEPHEWGVCAVTFVNNDILKANQEEKLNECISKTEDYRGFKLNTISELGEKTKKNLLVR